MREVLDVKHGYSENGEVHVPGAHQYRVLVYGTRWVLTNSNLVLFG
jgi:hypothetical protein